ncbi:hypothetical protein OESDEN_07657 [Oesophagostomum dentatum]|uniref:Uncharacterized protein n=1 Tax=Oesophagostomum dentatum TaxID=61180 RepID=A0A0B1T4E6_OESDE|nr:hypothetical protein OESDEN_07657 [Oesophagostomum dentatum]
MQQHHSIHHISPILCTLHSSTHTVNFTMSPAQYNERTSCSLMSLFVSQQRMRKRSK